MNRVNEVLRSQTRSEVARRPTDRFQARAGGLGERPVGQGFGQMQPADFSGAIEVGERTGDAQHAVIARARQPHGLRASRSSFNPSCPAGDFLRTDAGASRIGCGYAAIRPRLTRQWTSRAAATRAATSRAFGRRRQDQVGGGPPRHLDRRSMRSISGPRDARLIADVQRSMRPRLQE